MPRHKAHCVCDSDPAILEKARRSTGAEIASTDWREVIARDDINAVIIWTPNHVHAPISVAALEAGAPYAASKFAVRGHTQAINAEEQKNGIRACAIFPGDIDTPLLDKRPQPPPAEAGRSMLQPADITACVLLVLDIPAHAVVEEILIRPRSLA